VTAARLGAIPAGAATSLSITTGWQGHTEADVRAVAAAIAEPLGLRPEVHGHGGHAESVTVTFHRAGLRHR